MCGTLAGMRTKVAGLGVLSLMIGCGGAGQRSAEPQEGAAPREPSAGAPTKEEAEAPPMAKEAPAAPAEAAAKASPPAGTSGPVHPPGGGMKQKEAEQYVLTLINRDRAAQGLPKVVWDETAAAAGRRHAADLAAHGVTAHLGTDGSVPEQRYTEAGGGDMVMENAGCFADGIARELDPDPVFTKEGLARIEQAFMNEVPPSDGHRRNILNRSHTGVGVGFAQPRGIDVPCMVQEFIDGYGDYAPLPKKAKLGAQIHIEGKVRAPVMVAGVGLSRLPPRQPMKAAELSRTHAYAIPAPYAVFFPEGFKTKIPLKVDKADGKFSIDLPLNDGQKPGLYGVSVWATFPGSKELVMVSLRTIAVD
jgi:uncharacterized protein YkwD